MGGLLRHPSAALLLVQLLGVVLYPLMEATASGRAAFGAFGIVVLGISLRVVRRSPWLTWLAVLLALPIVVALLVRLVIEREEAYLQDAFGADYSDYRARVRRWL